MKNKVLRLALAILMVGLLPVIARADDDESSQGVARLSLINGEINTMRGDSGDWVAGVVNAPLVAGDRVTSGSRSRAEVQLDYANVMRLGPQTEVKLDGLGRRQIRVELATGLLNYTVMKHSEAESEILTPNVAVRPVKDGRYRIEVNSPSETVITVRKGRAEVVTPRGSTTVDKNESIHIRGTDNPEYQIAKAPRRDDWDDWNESRDNRIEDARSWRYANRYYGGMYDLDGYGRWVYVPGYGDCWTPMVAVGWAPYRYGRWTWTPYWGWTWVSYEPWGWAPYHYGRWFWHANYWHWWPGGYYGGYAHYRPVWGPAYVSFLGFGFGTRNWSFGVGFGFNSIGWLPLGPHDRYYPWHGRHNTYNVVSITNITNINNYRGGDNYRVHTFNRGRNEPYGSNLQAALTNERVRQAVTTVSADDFVRGRIQHQARTMDANTFRQGQVVQGRVPAVPTRESLRFGDREVSAPNVNTRGPINNFITRNRQPAATRSFRDEAADVQRMVQNHNPNRNAPAERAAAGIIPNANSNARDNRTGLRVDRFTRGQEREVAMRNPAAAPGQARNNAPTSAEQDGAKSQAATVERAREGRATNPAVSNQGAAQAPRGSEATTRPGWRRFGEGAPSTNQGRSAPSQTASPAARQPATAASRQSWPAPVSGGQSDSGWRRFENRERPTGTATTNTSEPRTAAPATRQTTPARAPATSPRSAPSALEDRGNWRTFSGPSRSAERDPGYQAPRGEASRESVRGWDRSPRAAPSRDSRSYGSMSQPHNFPSRSGGSVYRESPRTSSRPPLEIRKPIVTERGAARSSESRGSRSGGNWVGGRTESGSREGGRRR